MDICIEQYEANSDDESACKEAQAVAPIPALANVEPRENGYHRDNINDLLEVPAPGQGHEHVDAPVNVAANRGIGNWGVINAMPATNANPRWEWDEQFGFTHHGECLTCRLYRRHVIASKLKEDPGLEAAQAFPSQSARRAYDDGWMAREHTIPEMGVVFVGLAREWLEAINEPLNQLKSIAQIFECSLLGDLQAAII